MDNMIVNYYPIPMYIDPEEDIVIPEKMDLAMFSDIIHNTEEFNPGVKFNPSNVIFSESTLENNPGLYILHPVFSGETAYGYLICKINKNKFADISIYLKILITAFSAAIEYTNRLMEAERLTNKYSELQEDNSTLTKQSKTDELTGVLNRRGFYEETEKLLGSDKASNAMQIALVFADLDGLKHSNDTFGHNEGDNAIVTLGHALLSSAVRGELCARFGGDEFCIAVLTSESSAEKYCEGFKRSVTEYLQNYNDSSGKPYKVEASIGFYLNPLTPDLDLEELVATADKQMYEEKMARKARKNEEKA